MNDRITRCRYHNRYGNPCPNPSIGEDGEIQMCVKHVAEAIQLVRRVARENPAYAIAAGVVA